ncbi:MAG TPA: hypothetical protein GXX36_15130 [Clostridiaceae bacterium]|nr:hypothetical protein [Clostridiaceae bacterium]
MFYKRLENKITLDKNNHFFLENPITLEYYIFEREADSRDGLDGRKVYGIGISKTIDNRHYEENVVYNFSYNFDETKNVVNMLARNTVTPVELVPVLENILEMQI